VRAYIAEILVFTEKITRKAKPSIPHTAVLMKECRVLPIDFDIMGMRGTYHQKRIVELVERFKGWRGERISGVRAFQSTYDRVGVLVCKWFFQAVHDINAIGFYDYILPMMVCSFLPLLKAVAC
jgi:proteasome activator subunit 4